MNRREFMKSASATAVATGTGVAAPAVFSPAKAQARNEVAMRTWPGFLVRMGAKRPEYTESLLPPMGDLPRLRAVVASLPNRGGRRLS